MGLSTFVLAVSVACGGGGDGDGNADSAESAILRVFDYVDKGQWGKYWDLVHPAQQALVSREDFISCGSKLESGMPDIEDVKILETYDEDVRIPGTSEDAPSTALTIEYEVSMGPLKDTETDTVHAVEVDGQWRVMLSEPDTYIDCGG